MAKLNLSLHKNARRERNSRRNQILDAAQRCFKKQGFHKTTLRDIAQEFGMSAGHIYNYFSNKEAIIEALVAHAGIHRDARHRRIRRSAA